MRSNKNLSIKQIFSQVNRLMLIFAILPLLISAIMYSRQILAYQHTLTNIQNANNIAAKVDNDVLEEMWDVVTGQITVKRYEQKSIVQELQNEINTLQKNITTSEERSVLDVSSRVIDTLNDQQNEIITNLAHDNSYDANTEIMTQVKSATTLLSKILQEFVRIEINMANSKNQELIHSFVFLTLFEVVLVIIAIYISQKNHRFLVKNVEQPLHNLAEISTELSKGHFNYRLSVPQTPELAALTMSLNNMADNLVRLLEENAQKQYYLAQSEARVLQAQITPHFVYNSVDAIIALIEQQQYEEAKELTFALSDFFRISLSKGKDWIPIDTEIRHATDYLKILKIRYGEMLNYQVNIPPEIKSYRMLKMILQPIIENAIYHGIKFTRRVGLVTLSAKITGTNIIFTVTDNGIGVKPERLKEITTELKRGIESDTSIGYGLFNVNKRLLLYYGKDAAIDFKSNYGQGTTVVITVPKKGASERV
ncbi:sensor histidine kinase [Lapidilactobacillus wuchangensis]|uniref:sensor histidine kinase n=1 Tax=Lapidilactobacillus wuchangensis TaxID=2486001 RepID=UPI000F78F96A|nr:histidine kinase [Lapidilactobacillus wuchangensis]